MPHGKGKPAERTQWQILPRLEEVWHNLSLYPFADRFCPSFYYPAFLWDYVRNGGGFSGMFAGEHRRLREQIRAGRLNPPFQGVGEDDDIPF